MNLQQHVGALLTAVLFGGALVGCAVEDERPVPYEPQVTHTPKAKKTDDDGTGIDGFDEDGAGEDGMAEDGAGETGGESDALQPPPIPDAIYEETLEGAEAAARYYVEAFSYGYDSLDTKPLEFICEGSQTCEDHRETIKAIRDDGNVTFGGAISTGTTDELYSIDDKVVVSFSVSQGEMIIKDAKENVVQVSKPSTSQSNFLATFEEGQWKIHAITNQSV